MTSASIFHAAAAGLQGPFFSSLFLLFFFLFSQWQGKKQGSGIRTASSRWDDTQLGFPLEGSFKVMWSWRSLSELIQYPVAMQSQSSDNLAWSGLEVNAIGLDLQLLKGEWELGWLAEFLPGQLLVGLFFVCFLLSFRMFWFIFLFVLLCWWAFGIACWFVSGLGGKGCLF